MTAIKKQIIDWILSDDQNYDQGKKLLNQIDPTIKANTIADLNLHFSHWIRSGGNVGNVAVTRLAAAASSTSPDLSVNDISTEQKINLDIDRMLKIRSALHNKLHDCTTNDQRKAVLDEAQQVQDQIAYSKDLLRKLKAGHKEVYNNTYFSPPEENHFDVPDNLLELDKKYRYMMAIRAKRKAKVQAEEIAHGTNSLKHQQALAEWKHYDEVVNRLKSALDEKIKR